MNYWINFAFSMVFSLVQGGNIPANEYRRVRKLALRICTAMPPADFIEFASRLGDDRAERWGQGGAPFIAAVVEETPPTIAPDPAEALPAANPADPDEPAGAGPPAAAPAAPAAVFCPDCGATVEIGAEVCPGCGWESTKPAAGGTEVSGIFKTDNEGDPS